MKNLNRILRYFRILIFAFMFAVCMVLGIAPILPKRKEEMVVESIIPDFEKAPGRKDNAEKQKK